MSAKQENTKKRTGLGRGLGALLEDSDGGGLQARHPSDFAGSLEGVNLMDEIALELIETNPFQPREYFAPEALQELAESIRVQGIIQPITVRKVSAKKYQLISGERRFQASKIAGLKTIPAYVRTADDQQMIEMALIENIQRENLNAIEIALSYKRLMEECDLKQEDLGARVGKNRSTVTNYMRLLKLPPHIQVAIRDNKLSMGHARCLISLEDTALQNALFQKAIAEDWSVRRLEDAVRQSGTMDTPTPGTASVKVSAQELQTWQATLKSFFKAPVALKINEKGEGEIKLSFKTKEELLTILNKVQ
ncbi:ParB/RepB/Spo0J family partition protein [Aquirufa sp. KTFRIE-69F]|jgi:ParB family transcriptional regulator, chromosome partitioning protein|uniref:ParB/RepB/Spo0J family partition protein n=1 Tax=Aquirufa originis TaxID=3096514 RepID=A0ABW6D7A7_9BACT